ncbi:aspartyl-phosphate phosphatase Spo0E family protein [Sporosarcina sp. PTS2304]|uniref:aspartyl-phosphate phosphatase Spo0E family protein n=1 Tax=Sporosarcina sp. PTS2304 TaxID=2283194 RepID=UPI000E0DA724|nr:aspartyl-phosphate phosphatase Spo0E family protein [Sporosarcina sp. PTS2304]AXH98997.1 aspartyl-phosphate phosphatase Spo0E family protein [Sporosarcina sp. PTS2304]
MKSAITMKYILFRIKLKKLIMYKKAGQLGFTHPSVVKCSSELDHLLNRIQGICD